MLNLRARGRTDGVGGAPAERPYWWDDAAPLDATGASAPPEQVDVAIVGSGLTGLSAARRLHAGGATVAVLDSGPIASGASSRNFGMLGRQYVHSYRALLARFGEERARALYGCCDEAFTFVNALIDEERIDCMRQPAGRLVTCATTRQLDELSRELDLRARDFGHEHRMLDRAGLKSEIGSPWYVGGAVLPEHKAIHPGRFAFGLARKLAARGVATAPGTELRAYARTTGGWQLETSRGPVRAAEIVVATNGYTGPATPWLRRRIVPLPAYMIATEPLPCETLAAVLPRGRPWHDSARDMAYARISPDGTRLLFGGATGEAHADLGRLGRRLRERMLKLFPGLPGDLRLSHVWTGRCGGTFDLFPHTGESAGAHYALGYCFGAGMPFGAWLGDGLGRRILGEPVENPLAGMAMPTRPLYRGRPWFMPLYLAWRKLQDRREGARVGM